MRMGTAKRSHRAHLMGSSSRTALSLLNRQPNRKNPTATRHFNRSYLFGRLNRLIDRRHFPSRAWPSEPQTVSGTDRSQAESIAGWPEGSDPQPYLRRPRASPTLARQGRFRLSSCVQTALDAPPKSLQASLFGKCWDVRGSRRREKEKRRYAKKSIDTV